MLDYLEGDDGAREPQLDTDEGSGVPGEPDSPPDVRRPASVWPVTNPVRVEVKGEYTAPSYALLWLSAVTVRWALLIVKAAVV